MVLGTPCVSPDMNETGSRRDQQEVTFGKAPAQVYVLGACTPVAVVKPVSVQSCALNTHDSPAKFSHAEGLMRSQTFCIPINRLAFVMEAANPEQPAHGPQREGRTRIVCNDSGDSSRVRILLIDGE